MAVEGSRVIKFLPVAVLWLRNQTTTPTLSNALLTGGDNFIKDVVTESL